MVDEGIALPRFMAEVKARGKALLEQSKGKPKAETQAELPTKAEVEAKLPAKAETVAESPATAELLAKSEVESEIQATTETIVKEVAEDTIVQYMDRFMPEHIAHLHDLAKSLAKFNILVTAVFILCRFQATTEFPRA